MPHITIECSTGIISRIGKEKILKICRDAVMQTDVFDASGLRFRLYGDGFWSVGETGSEGKEAIHVCIEARKRPLEVKKRLVETLHSALKKMCEAEMPDTILVIVSVNIHDLDETYLTADISA